MKKAILILIFLSSISLFAQVKFILRPGDNKDYCKNITINFILTIKNDTAKSIWVFDGIKIAPIRDFYLMIKKAGEKDFTEVYFPYCFFGVSEKDFIEIKPHSAKEFNLEVSPAAFPDKYIDRGFLFGLVRKITKSLKLLEWKTYMPLKAGEYEVYFVYNRKLNSVKYKFPNILIGKFRTNTVKIRLPECDSNIKKKYLKKEYERNKGDIYAAFTIYGILIFAVLVLIALIWLIVKLLKFLIKRIKARSTN